MEPKKIILNAGAFKETGNEELQGFLRYVKTGKVTTAYTGRIEQMIRTVKMSEQMRKEYRILPAVLMDAFDEGESRGSRQAKLETAKILKQFGDSIQKIMQATGLSKEEVEAINN